MSTKPLRTGEVAARAGVSVATLRYYERRGLIPEPMRTASGYREFPPETVAILCMIRRAKKLGFTLNEIRTLTRLQLGPGGTCTEVHQLAREKIADLESKLRRLTESRDILSHLVEQCRGNDRLSASKCQLLRYLVEPDSERAA